MTNPMALLRKLVETPSTYSEGHMTVHCTYCGCLTYFHPDEGIPLSKPHADDCPWRLAKEFVRQHDSHSD